MFSLLQLFIGGYLLYSAVTGRGKVFENEFLKVPREAYVKRLRILSAISGAILIATSVLEYLGFIVPGSPLGWAAWAVGFGSIVPMMVYSSKSTDKEAARANQPSGGQPGPKRDPLRAAFVFEEDEPGKEPTADNPGETGK